MGVPEPFRYQRRQRPSDDLLGAAAKDPRGGGIPAGHAPVRGDGDDGVPGRLHDRSVLGVGGLSFLHEATIPLQFEGDEAGQRGQVGDRFRFERGRAGVEGAEGAGHLTVREHQRHADITPDAELIRRGNEPPQGVGGGVGDEDRLDRADDAASVGVAER